MAEIKTWNVDMATIDGSTEEVFIDYNDSQQVSGAKFKTEPTRMLEWITRHQASYTREAYKTQKAFTSEETANSTVVRVKKKKKKCA